jgi:FdhD protein
MDASKPSAISYQLSAANPNPSSIARRTVSRYVGQQCNVAEDDLTVEEPLQIRLAGEDVAVTMRTPGHDIELAAGFLYSDGIINGKAHIESIAHCSDENGLPAPNIINVFPTDRDLVDPRRWRRDFFAASSCGLCGKTSLESVTRSLPRAKGDATVTLDTLYSLGEKLRKAQEGFARSGGLHAAGLFDLEGNLLLLREDIGRHNAVDKIVGHALLYDVLPLDRHVLLVSSRASFEIVQKALAAGVSIMAVISAPSSLAVELAEQAGMTLVAFLREGRLNVYAGRERIAD